MNYRAQAAKSRLASALFPLVLCLPARAQEHRPPIFQDLDFPSALEAAKAQGGVMILDAMTSWCGPCKQMDRTTWIDPRLVQWIETNGVAIQLDMDENVALKEKLEIRAFPTILLFKDGVEFDRVVGLRTAEEMLEWLGAGMTGKRAKDTVLERLTELRASTDPAGTWGERAKLVADLMWFGEQEEALTEHLWLWENMTSMGPHASSNRERYRWSTQRFSMRELADGLPAARDAFAKLRDGLTAAVEGDTASENQLRDWIELNYVISDETASVRWAQNNTGTEDGLRRLRGLEQRLFDVLIAHDAWATAGLALRDPVGQTRQQRDRLGAYDEDPAPAPEGGMLPAIPIGGMQPARKAAADDGATTLDASSPAGDSNSTRDSDTKKPMPMIPMGSTPRQIKKRDSMPMIPMGGMRPSTTPEETVAQKVRGLLTEQFRRQASERYGALLAAGRQEDARAVAGTLIGEVNDSRARAALLSTALRAGAIQSASEVHLEWLEWIAR